MQVPCAFLVLETPASGRKRLCAIRVGAPRHSMLTCMLLLLQLSGAVGQLCTILLATATATAAADTDAERAASAAHSVSAAAAAANTDGERAASASDGVSARGGRRLFFHGHSPHGHYPHGHDPHSHSPHSHLPTGPCSNTCNYASDGDCDDGGPGAEFAECSLGTDYVAVGWGWWLGLAGLEGF